MFKINILFLFLISCSSSRELEKIDYDKKVLQTSLNECLESRKEQIKISDLYDEKKYDLKLCERRLKTCNQKLQNSGY